MPSKKKVIVVGGGVCGLTAAYRLLQAGFDPLVIEKRDYPGGRTRSISKNGFIIDEGASIFPSKYTDVLALVKELGLTEKLNKIPTRYALFRDGQLLKLDMTNPFRAASALPSLRLIDKLSLLRMVPTLFRYWSKLNFYDLSGAADTDIETIKEFCQRKGITDNAYEYVLNPILKSLGAVEGDTGSMTHMLWIMRNFMTNTMYAFHDGFNTLAREIAKHVDVRYETSVLDLKETSTGVEVHIKNARGIEERLNADYCAIGTHASDLLAVYPNGLTEMQRDYLSEVPYIPLILITFLTKTRPDCDAVVINIPKTEIPDMCILVQNHYYSPARAPEGKGLITFTGMPDWQQRMLDQPDDVVKADALRLTRQVFPLLDHSLEEMHVSRWRPALTISKPGTFKKLVRFNADRVQDSRIQYSGDYMAISSVGTAVGTGNDLARRIQKSDTLNRKQT